MGVHLTWLDCNTRNLVPIKKFKAQKNWLTCYNSNIYRICIDKYPHYLTLLINSILYFPQWNKVHLQRFLIRSRESSYHLPVWIIRFMQKIIITCFLIFLTSIDILFIRKFPLPWEMSSGNGQIYIRHKIILDKNLSTNRINHLDINLFRILAPNLSALDSSDVLTNLGSKLV